MNKKTKWYQMPWYVPLTTTVGMGLALVCAMLMYGTISIVLVWFGLIGDPKTLADFGGILGYIKWMVIGSLISFFFFIPVGLAESLLILIIKGVRLVRGVICPR